MCVTVYGANSDEMAAVLNHLAFIYFRWSPERHGVSCEQQLAQVKETMRRLHGEFSVPHLCAVHNWLLVLVEFKR